MSHLLLRDRQSPLFAELRRFASFRWFVGIIVMLGAVTAFYWDDPANQSMKILIVGGAILAYNLLLWIFLWRFRNDTESWISLFAISWIQISLDLFCLSLLVLWTGGIVSPLLGLFVLHMVFASLLLSPLNAYLCAILATAMMAIGLWGTGQWPQSNVELMIGPGWIGTLILTVFLANHITQSLRKQEVRLRDQHGYIKSILDTAADGIVTIDEDGIILSVNPACERIFGYSEEEMLGENIRILMPEPYRSEHDDYITNYLKSRQSHIIGVGREVTGRRKDGSTFPLDAAVSEVRTGFAVSFTGIVRDITERKEAQDALKALNEELKKQQKVLVQSEKMSAMGQMAAGVAHEIANPLASMDSLLQLIKRMPERMNEDSVDTLREQIDRIRQIVQQMTSFAHPNETGWQTVSLNETINSALKMASFDHRLRDINVDLDLPEQVGAIRIIPEALQQVLINMFLNALDALEGISKPKLTITTQRNNHDCVIEITDNGQGIPPDQLSKVFEPFFTTKPVGKGTGLGLSISYSLIQQHGGSCDVQSPPPAVDGKPTQGTTFFIRLPIAGPTVQ